MKANQPNQNRSPLESTNGPKPPPPARKAYRKPSLRRLGELKAVAGSGIMW